MATIAPIRPMPTSKIIRNMAPWICISGLLVTLFPLGCVTRTFGEGSRDAGPDADESDVRKDPYLSTVPTDAGSLLYTLRLGISPVPQLDLVFVLDNSPSMAAKQQKLSVQFSKLISALKDPITGKLIFDLRAAIIDSDMGGASSAGACGPKANGSLFGDQGKFQFINAAACGVTDTSQPWLFENRNVSPVQKNFSGDFAAVFGCLASAVGASACGFSQPLQALESAFYDPSNAALQRDTFLRPNAYLGIVIITDQDDCSAGSDHGIFAEALDAASESTSLRCTTRASACNGQNLSILPPGYPTTTAFSANLADCATRTDFCDPDVDTAQATDCNPLKDYRAIANELKQLKSHADEQIVVSGVFGWPLDDRDLAKSQLIIDKIPNPDTTVTDHPQIFDAWPICYDPDHLPAHPGTGFDPAAAAWGATPGLRLSAFIDEFGRNGRKLSICEPDLSNAMVWYYEIQSYDLCIAYKLVDIDLVQPGVQASCEAWDSLLVQGSQPASYTESAHFSKCDDALSVVPCWQAIQARLRCGRDGVWLVQVVREPDATFNPGTKVNMQCQVCPDSAEGSTTLPGCDYSL
jgi:hypothetical protein